MFMFEDEKEELYLEIAEGLQCWTDVEACVFLNVHSSKCMVKDVGIQYFVVQCLEIFIRKVAVLKSKVVYNMHCETV